MSSSLQTLLECSQENLLANDLANIHASELQPRVHLAAFHALYVAVDRCRDMVHVTDDRHVVQVGALLERGRKDFIKITYLLPYEFLDLFIHHGVHPINEISRLTAVCEQGE